MYARMDKPAKIYLSMCDESGRLSIPGLFTLFIDAASEHGTEIGLGMEDLAKKNLFWLAVKTKIQITDRPALLEDVTISTWPEEPGRVGCNRYYALTAKERQLAVGKTEWAMIHKESGKLTKLAEVYPEGLVHCPEKSCADPFLRPGKDFADGEEVGRYTVRSTDIDIGCHMNNAAYVRMLFGAFSCAELAARPIREVEIAYRKECREGEELTIRRKVRENSWELAVIKPTGETAATAHIVFA